MYQAELLLRFSAVGVWFEYVQYSIGGMGQPGGMECVREVFELAITACGLHFTRGGTIWEAYREFENAILTGLQVFIVVYLTHWLWTVCKLTSSFLWQKKNQKKQKTIVTSDMGYGNATTWNLYTVLEYSSRNWLPANAWQTFMKDIT